MLCHMCHLVFQEDAEFICCKHYHFYCKNCWPQFCGFCGSSVDQLGKVRSVPEGLHITPCGSGFCPNLAGAQLVEITSEASPSQSTYSMAETSSSHEGEWTSYAADMHEARDFVMTRNCYQCACVPGFSSPHVTFFSTYYYPMQTLPTVFEETEDGHLISFGDDNTTCDATNVQDNKSAIKSPHRSNESDIQLLEFVGNATADSVNAEKGEQKPNNDPAKADGMSEIPAKEKEKNTKPKNQSKYAKYVLVMKFPISDAKAEKHLKSICTSTDSYPSLKEMCKTKKCVCDKRGNLSEKEKLEFQEVAQAKVKEANLHSDQPSAKQASKASSETAKAADKQEKELQNEDTTCTARRETHCAKTAENESAHKEVDVCQVRKGQQNVVTAPELHADRAKSARKVAGEQPEYAETTTSNIVVEQIKPKKNDSIQPTKERALHEIATHFAQPTQAPLFQISHTPTTCPVDGCDMLVFPKLFVDHIEQYHTFTAPAVRVEPKNPAVLSLALNHRQNEINPTKLFLFKDDRFIGVGHGNQKGHAAVMPMYAFTRIEEKLTLLLWLTGVVPTNGILKCTVYLLSRLTGMQKSAVLQAIMPSQSQQISDVYKTSQFISLTETELPAYIKNGSEMLHVCIVLKNTRI